MELPINSRMSASARKVPQVQGKDRLIGERLKLRVDSGGVYTIRIYVVEGPMGTARVFRSGNSQAVRLPKQFRLKSKEVEIFRRGDEIVLREKNGTMVRAFDLLASLPDDLEVIGRQTDQPQTRQGL